MTPKITGVSVTSSTMTITGTDFSATVSDNTVSVGPFPVTVSSASTTQLVVSIADLPAGTHVVDVLVALKGYATGSTSARSHTVTPTVTAVSPAMSSISGGASVTITGTGFDHTTASANNVDLCYSDCAVESATATTIVCTSGALVNSAKYDIGRPLQLYNLIMLPHGCLGVQLASLLFTDCFSSCPILLLLYVCSYCPLMSFNCRGGQEPGPVWNSYFQHTLQFK